MTIKLERQVRQVIHLELHATFANASCLMMHGDLVLPRHGELSHHWGMIACREDVLPVGCDLHALACSREFEVLNQLQAPQIIIVLSQRSLLVFR